MHSSVDINILAVIAATFSAMIIGALWYGPIFGKAWMKELGFTEESLKEGFNPVKTYGITVLSHFVIAFVLAYLVDYVQASDLRGALFTAVFTWLGFTAAPMVIGAQFTNKSVKLLFIDVFHYLVVMVIMSIILTLWV